MKTINRLTKITFVGLALLVLTAPVSAYPPDNAAVLYYKAALSYQPDKDIEGQLSDLSRGEIKLNEQIRKFVEKNQSAIDITLEASNIPSCDWGTDFSKGLEAVMPHISATKHLALLILADARILAEQGDYETALNHCLSVHRIGRHVIDRNFVCYLLGSSISGRTNTCIADILSDMPEDLERLNWLKGRLAGLENKSPLFVSCFDAETEFGASMMQSQKIGAIQNDIRGEELKALVAEQLRTADEAFFEKNRAYWNKVMTDAKAAAASGLPYQQTYTQLQRYAEKVPIESMNNPDTILTAWLMPGIQGVYSIGIRADTSTNAARAAVEIYIIKAKTGKLPQTLPAGLPKDLFSGRDFQYEKTADGFTLRCQGKDRIDDKIHQYEFKVK